MTLETLFSRARINNVALFAGNIILAMASLSQLQAYPVWVIPSLDRVSPTQGAGTTTQASISAAKGEYESFQVIVQAPAGGLNSINLTASNLTGPGGASISSSNITLYREQF